jgi:hypothetical protein
MHDAKALIQQRLDDLIHEGELILKEFELGNRKIYRDAVRFAQWMTSSFNLLDKLSISTNRFVKEFERWTTSDSTRDVNIGAALGVLKSARDEYSLGLAVEYHLSVSAAVFDGLLDEANYLLTKGYPVPRPYLWAAHLKRGSSRGQERWALRSASEKL